MSRARRIAEMEKAKARARRVVVGCWGLARTDDRFIGKLATTITPCSCWACGNRRGYEGPTRKELQHTDKEA